jgi:hypothetical protein
VLYELCCGRPPFVGEGSGDVLAAHIHVPVQPLSSMGADLPSAVEQLIHRLLAKAPGDRVQTADALVCEIDELLGERPSTHSIARGSVPQIVTVQEPARPTLPTLPGATLRMLAVVRRRFSIATASVGLATVVAAIVVIVAVCRGTDSGPPAGAHRVVQAAPAPAARALAPSTAGAEANAAPVVAAAPVPPALEDAPRNSTSAARAVASPDERAVDHDPPPALHALAAPHSVAVAIDSAPPGASVLLDGAALGTTPYRGRLARSDRERRLTVHLAGYADHVVVAAPGQPVRERVLLWQVPAAAPKKQLRSTRDLSVNPF